MTAVVARSIEKQLKISLHRRHWGCDAEEGDRQLGQKWRRTLALLVYLLFAAAHLTTRCISVGVHLLTRLPDRVEAALLVRRAHPPNPPLLLYLVLASQSI